MRTIICKKCGAEIDASLGVCPHCGAIYYILPEEEDKKLDWAMNPDSDIDETRAFGKSGTNTDGTGEGNGAHDLMNADNDELFNTHVWKTADVGQGTDKTPPAHRQMPPRPVRQTVKQDPLYAQRARAAHKDKEKQLRKKQLIVAAVALLAVLTLVLSIMGGLFNFSGSDNDKMPNVLGQTKESATTILENMGLEVDLKEVEDEAAAGLVIKQSIKEGKTVKEGEKVTITASLGESADVSESPDSTTGDEYVEVPALTDKTYDEAFQILNDLDLHIQRNDDKYSDEDVGIIISQSPMKGAKLKAGDTVSVTVSMGPEPSPSPTDHTISVTAGKGGSISPKGAVTVEDGESETFTITPDSGYEISEVKIDGTSIGAQSSYTFTKVTEDHTIYAVFKKTTGESPTPSPSSSPTETTNPSSGTDIG